MTDLDSLSRKPTSRVAPKSERQRSCRLWEQPRKARSARRSRRNSGSDRLALGRHRL